MLKRGLSNLAYNVVNPTQFEQLTQKIKSLEKVFELQLSSTLPYIIRLDGCCFKTFTKGFKKPFDERLTESMIQTTKHLVERFGARLGFCQSDEISLVLKPVPPDPTCDEKSTLLYSGRVQKIASVVAGYATAQFNRCLLSHRWSEEESEVRDRVSQEGGFFDCRVFSIPDDLTAMQTIYWRHHYDCRRNAINMIGFNHFPHKELHGLTVPQVIEKVTFEKNIDILSHYQSSNVFGTFVKRKIVPHIGFNPRTGESVMTSRNRIEGRSFNMQDDNEQQMVQLVISTSWNEYDQWVEGNTKSK